MNVENVGNLEAIEMNIEMLDKMKKTGIPQSFSKQRVPTSEKAYKRYSFFENVYRYTRQTEYYKAFAESVRDVSRYLRNPVMKTAILRSHGQPMYDMLNNWIDDVARGSEKMSGKYLDSVSAALRTNFVVAVLGANLSTVTKQPLSFNQGSDYIGRGWALRGLGTFLKNPNASIRFVHGKSVQMKNRAFAQERELQEIMKGRKIPKIFGQKDIRALKQMAKEGSMKPILLADQATVVSLWLGAYAKMMEQTNGNEQVAIDYADKAIRRTQPQAGVMHLPQLFKEPHFVKMLTLFRNQPNQNTNLIYDTFKEFNKSTKNKEDWSKFSKRTFFLIVMGGLLWGYASQRRHPKNLKEVALNMANQAVGGVVLLGDLVRKIQYPWGSSNMLDSAISEASKIISSKKPATKLKYTGRTIGKTVGIPGYLSIERLLLRESLKTKILGGEREKKKKSYKLSF